MATEKELRNKVATWGNSYKGIKEGGSEHKELVNIFNDSGLCTRYKMTTSDAWCALFVSDAFIANDLTGIFPCVECSCQNMISLAQSAGIWQEDDSYVPSIGDAMLYDWDDSGSGDNTGIADHVGIVQSVSGSSITVIEGNKSDTVGTRSMTVNGRYIRGYITPDYASAASGSSSSSSSSTTAKSIDELAQEVISGEWGNDPDRSSALTAAGYDAGAVQARVNELMGTSSSSSSSSSSSKSSAPTYKVGTTYTVKVDALRVRTGAGTDYSVKSYSQLTANAQANAYVNGTLKKGTRVDCLATKNVGSDIWIKIPSGWIAAYYNGATYVG